MAFTEPLCMLLRRLQHSTVFSFLLFTGCAEAGVTVAPSPRSHASQGRCGPVCGGVRSSREGLLASVGGQDKVKGSGAWACVGGSHIHCPCGHQQST